MATNEIGKAIVARPAHRVVTVEPPARASRWPADPQHGVELEHGSAPRPRPRRAGGAAPTDIRSVDVSPGAPRPSAAFETQRIAQRLAAPAAPGATPAGGAEAYDDGAFSPLPRFDLVRPV